MTPGDRRKHHTQELRRVAFFQGKEGADAYRLRHPEARSILVNVNTLAYSPKPSGYADVVASMAELWFDSDTAADSDDPAQGYRHDHAHRSDLIPRGIPI
ncbi:hypothetical protein [Sphingopyxis sp. L1A2A]|uniref:hypothetical protein n=1 Tax=Sphingopyxis sp. L1A2A TaxID=2502247 RepID=UPI0010F8EAFD|nr:hypothetical protein [Sphingopyxis sp. L1A2A]